MYKITNNNSISAGLILLTPTVENEKNATKIKDDE